MKNLFTLVLVAGLLSASLFTCSKADQEAETTAEVSQEVLALIAQQGFSVEGVIKEGDHYIVEGDIVLHEADLYAKPTSPNLLIAQEEHYNTFNLVTGLPRTITITTSGNIPAGLSTAINSAIARYNAEGLGLTFVRASSGPSGSTINIRLVNTGQYIASAGFPSGGNPYPQVNYAKKYSNYSQGFMTTVLAHEIGHCIGFRHTDYMNRAYSCGSGGNEGQETTGVGAVHIPGTPTGPDAGSWMLACLGASTDRPFNSNDRTALNYLY